MDTWASFSLHQANPWWSTRHAHRVLFSAMVRGLPGHAAVHRSMKLKKRIIDMRCVDTIAKYLFYTFVIDFTWRCST